MSGSRFRALLTVSAIAAIAALTACTGSDLPTPSPTPTASLNAKACSIFSSTTAIMGDALSGEDVDEKWAYIRSSMDSAALKADGDVKKRLTALVEDWPKPVDIIVYRQYDDINVLLDDVARACKADGAKVAYYSFGAD